jgi:zinc protease
MPPAPPVAPLLDANVNIPSYEMTLDNGLTVVAIPNDEIPFVTVTLGNLYGAWTDPAEAPGTASMAHSMLTRGTDNFTYEQLAEELDYYAISLSGSAGQDTATVSASSVTDQADRTFAYLAEVVMNPTFPESELKKLVRQARTGKAIEEKSPEFLAEREMRRRLYGDHPYSRSADGEMSDLDNLSAGAMRQWWDSYVRPDTSVLYIAGDLTREEAFAHATKYFADWKAEGGAPVVELPSMPIAEATHIYLVDRAGDQAQIRAGLAHQDFTRHHPMYFPTRLLTQYFGGGFNSRLNKTIRVEKGLTYGAFGGLTSRRFGGGLTISTFSKNATTAEAVQAIIDEVRRLKHEAPSEEELTSARQYLVGSFVLNRETPQSVVSDQWLLRNENLPTDYYQRFLQGVREADGEQIMTAINDLIDENRLTIVVVGPAAQLKEDLEKIAPVTVVKPS